MKTAARLFAIASLALGASPALADTITFDSSDIGKSYTLNYNGFVDSTTIAGLTAQTVFTLTGISGSTFNFNYAVANTTSAPVGSRISSFGFNSNPEITSASSTGAFAFSTLDSSYPNGIGSVDVCFKDAATGSCAGGGSGGLSTGQTGSGTFSLSFASGVASIDLGSFYVRYQSITGVSGVGSASGEGTMTSSSGGTPVPEPGMLGLFGGSLVAFALLRRRRSQRRAAIAA